MEYTKISFQTSTPDIILAFIQDLPFDSFEDSESHLDAFIPSKDYTEDVKTALLEVQERFETPFTATIIPYQNWNAIWESNFTPIRVHDFCGIRADFHPDFTPKVEHDILIQPKMAFGTGHHATTWMMINAMKNLDFKGKSVFDYGCGTGILALLASKLGANPIDAVDIEAPAVENSLEHLSLNGVNNVKVYEGTLSILAKNSYDIILANINRNVILDSLPTLYQQVNHQGYLLISGFILEDKNLLIDAIQQHNFETTDIQEKENWICIVCKKN